MAKMWAMAASILIITITWGWFQNNGDISFGRLDNIPYIPIQWYHVVAPAVLLALTQVGVPVSTTFLVLSTFSTGIMFEKMLVKSMLGYAISACVAYCFWLGIAKFLDEKKKVPKEREKNLARCAMVYNRFSLVYLDYSRHSKRCCISSSSIGADVLVTILVFLSAVLAIMFKTGGGKIQDIVAKKSSTSYVRSATIIDFVYAIILLVFKEWSNIPMSTTWVFVGLLCGRELAIATWYNRKIKRVFPMIAKDFLKVMMGLSVSVVMILLVNLCK